MAKNTKEAVAERYFYDWCRTRGLWCIKLNITGFRGMPDRMVLGPGRLIVFVEFKRQGKDLTNFQRHIHDILREWCFPVATCRTKEEAIDFVRTTQQHYIQTARLPGGGG